VQKIQLLSQVTSTGAGTAVTPPAGEHADFLRSYLVGLTGGTSAEVNIEVSNDNKCWAILATVTLGAGECDGTSSAVPYRYIRANVVSVAGGGSVDALMTLGTP
jgi:hypothetical protein